MGDSQRQLASELGVMREHGIISEGHKICRDGVLWHLQVTLPDIPARSEAPNCPRGSYSETLQPDYAKSIFEWDYSQSKGLLSVSEAGRIWSFV